MKTIILITCIALNAGAQTILNWPTNTVALYSIGPNYWTNHVEQGRITLPSTLPDNWPKDLNLVVDFKWELATNWFSSGTSFTDSIPGAKPIFIENGIVSSNFVMVVKDGSRTHQIILRSETLWVTNRAYQEKVVREYK